MGSPALICLASAQAATVSSMTCMKLCAFDANTTGKCLVSRSYVATLIQVFQGGIWGNIVSHLQNCELHGERDCTTTANCEVDSIGLCTASRSWAAKKLAAPVSEGGVGWGAERCGILGELIAQGAGCASERNASSCGTNNQCSLSEQNNCGVSRQAALVLLQNEYRDELTRVSLRRARCAAQKSRVTCLGDCRWTESPGVQGRCLLQTLDALLAVLGDDCPLRVLLGRHARCRNFVSSAECLASARLDGIPDCMWRSQQCEANPVSLEFDLLYLLGLDHPSIARRFSRASATCASYISADQCHQPCAPPVTLPQNTAMHRGLCRLFLLAAGAVSLDMITSQHQ